MKHLLFICSAIAAHFLIAAIVFMLLSPFFPLPSTKEVHSVAVPSPVKPIVRADSITSAEWQVLPGHQGQNMVLKLSDGSDVLIELQDEVEDYSIELSGKPYPIAFIRKDNKASDPKVMLTIFEHQVLESYPVNVEFTNLNSVDQLVNVEY